MASQLFTTFARNASRIGWLELLERHAEAGDHNGVTKWNGRSSPCAKSEQPGSFQRATHRSKSRQQPYPSATQGPVNSIGIALAHYRLKHSERMADHGTTEERY